MKSHEKFYKILLISLLFIFIIQINLILGEQKNNKKIYLITLNTDINSQITNYFYSKLDNIDKSKIKLIIIEIDVENGDIEQAEEISKKIDEISQSGIPVYAYIIGKAVNCGSLIALSCDRIYMKKDTFIGGTIDYWKDKEEEFISKLKKTFSKYAEQRGYSKALAQAMVDKSMEIREIFYKGERFFMETIEYQKWKSKPEIDTTMVRDMGIIVNPGKLLYFNEKKAKQYGFCRGIYEDIESLIEGLKLTNWEILKEEELKNTGISNFLTNPWVKFIFLGIGLLLIIVEFMTPGLGLAGILGVCSLILFFVGSYLSYTAGLLEILMFIIGLMLLAIEIFVIPGFGIVGILGILLCFFSIILCFQNFVFPRNDRETDILLSNIFKLTTVIGIDMIILMFLIKFIPKNKNAPLSKLSLSTVQSSEEGYSIEVSQYTELLNKEGIALSKLRPSGIAKIEEKEYNVVSLGDFIEKGEKIKVINVQGNQIIVEKIE